MPSLESPQARGLPPEAAAAFFFVLAAFLFSLGDIHLLHPGLAWPDEANNLQFIQEWREGHALPLSYAKGCLHRAAAAFSGGWGPPSLGRIHLPAFGAFLAECAFLSLLGTRWLGASAGSWAVTANALASFSLLRLRSLLSYSLLPAELLGMLALMPYCGAPLGSFLWGLAAGLFLLDYEAWSLGLMVLGLAWVYGNKSSRPSPWPALSGLSCGAACVAWLSRPEWADFISIRSSQSVLPALGAGRAALMAQNLKGYWLGATAMPGLGAAHWPAFPPAAWPALFLGLALALRSKPWILAWMAAGFTPIIAAGSFAEPQRMIVAWPALCLLAGWGFAALQASRPRFFPALLALAALGFGLEARAYLRSMDSQYEEAYGHSAQLISLSRKLAASGQSFRLISDLDCESAADVRFVFEAAGLRSDAQSPPLAVVPADYAYGLEKHSRLVQAPWPGAAAPLWVCFPDAALARRLEGVEAELGALRRPLPYFEARQARAALSQWLALHPSADPWLRSAVFEKALGLSFMLGEFPAGLVHSMQAQKLQSAAGLVWASEKIGRSDPAWSARLLKRAKEVDPRLN